MTNEDLTGRCRRCKATFLKDKWGMWFRAGTWYCFDCIEEMNHE